MKIDYDYVPPVFAQFIGKLFPETCVDYGYRKKKMRITGVFWSPVGYRFSLQGPRTMDWGWIDCTSVVHGPWRPAARQ